mgnify:FL=1
MARTQRNFVLGRMNKSLDERLLRNGEYVDALNVRLGSTEESEVGSVENTKGNTQLSELYFIEPGTTNSISLSDRARTIGVYEDGANETIYWFVHDPAFSVGSTGKLDMILSFNSLTGEIIYHIISIDDGGGINTTLNFNPQFLITGTNKVGDLLFFTDFLNPPRFINVKKSYGEPEVATPVTPTGEVVFSFTAGSITNSGITRVGFLQGLVPGCPTPLIAVGAGAAPTTTQINLPGTGCYNTIVNAISVNAVKTTRGFGIIGANSLSTLALIEFNEIFGVVNTIKLGLITADGTGNPGSGVLSGNITGSDGSSGTYYSRYEPNPTQFTDDNGSAFNPSSSGTVSLIGLTLTDGVTYTLTI